MSKGDEVIVVDELNDYYDISIKHENLSILKQYPNCSIHLIDICNSDAMQKLFREENFDVVCHLAARAGVRPSIQNPFIYVHSNILGTTCLLELASRYSIKNFVFASSSSVYGANVKAPFSEADMVDNPMSPYAATKRSCELIAWTFHSLYKLPISALRFFTVYGPRGRPDMAPFIFLDSIYRGIPIKQFGDGSSRRDYTYIDDILQGVIGALDNPRPYEIYNLGRGETIMLKDFIALIEELLEKKAIINQHPEQPGDVPLTFADVSKAKAMINYCPMVSTREGMKKTIEWYLSKYEKKD